MATTNEWYQRSVNDYEDKVRDYSADLAFLNEQIQTANNSIADLRRRRFNAADDEEVEVLTEQINNVTSRRNGLELRQADTQRALTQAESSLTQARADLARVNQGAPAETLPEQPPSAPAADPASRQAETPVVQEQSQLADNFDARDVTSDDVAAVGQFQAGTADDVPTTFGTDDLDPGLSPYGEEDDPQESQPRSTAPEPLQPSLSPYGEEDDFFDEESVESFDANAVTADDFAAVGQFETATADDIAAVRQPEPPLNYSVAFEDGFGWVILDNDTGSFIETDFATQAEADQRLAELKGFSTGTATQAQVRAADNAIDEENLAAADTKAKLEQAKQQFQLQQRYNQTTQGDWRVTIRLAPDASYLYKAPGIAAGDILSPLAASDGVIFPYVPTITTNYVARYDPYELVHSNYRGFFYKNSHVGEIQINGLFTAQDTAEAQYLLAVIHFFRSCTKMFYGQDPKFRGSPPPLVELSGFGQYQFNNHPCLVSNFNYTLPNGVDYIRVNPNNLSQGLSLAPRRPPVAANNVSLDSVANKLLNNNLLPGAEPKAGRSDLGYVAGTTSGTVQTTYVPTKMEIQLTLLPIQTRDQVSRGFSLEAFARGRLLTGGFW